jgi:tetratricopeptide (TPR) repeat protein
MLNRLMASLREAPATVPALVALALFIVWATDQAGYPVTHWAPGGLIVLGLLGLAVGVLGLRTARVPPPVLTALACLAAYTALSYLSILWAAVPGDAWEGANRTLLYLLVFALFACWRQRGMSAALLIGLWTLAITGLAAFVLLHVNAASSASLNALLPGGRLIYPSGYANANAAQWLMAFWVAALLARSRNLPWVVRGLSGGGAVLLAEVALLSQSRGSLYATPVMLLVVFGLLPGRARTFAVLVPLAIAIGAAAPAVLRVGDNLDRGQVVPATIHSATSAVIAAAVVAGVVVALGAAIESRLVLSEISARRIHRGVGAAALATLVALLVGGWVAAGDPVARVRHGWNTFKGGYAANESTNNRLTSGLGSNRYDFFRVALNEFAAHPLVGIGADNFQEQYLVHGRSDETPRYPHSVEFRTLAQTGAIGALLALVGLGAALLAALRAARPRSGGAQDPLGQAVALAAVAGFAYWLVHGSVDWLWEFAGLGAPAFALLGLACALTPSAQTAAGAADERSARRFFRRPAWIPRGRRLPVGRRAGILLGIALALAAAVSLAAPWLSQLQVQSAARVWTRAPATAYARLDEAAQLNPLSDEAYLLAGTIASRYGDLKRADREFSLALGRTPGDAYATFERGAIASASGDRARAIGLLGQAARLDPRDPLVRRALSVVRSGQRLSIDELNRAILRKAQQFG